MPSTGGGIVGTGFDADEVFACLIEALGARDPNALPIRGPSEFRAQSFSGYVYRHRLVGSIASFSSVEQIRAQSELAYERVTLGGWSGDGASFYGAPVSLSSDLF